MNDELSYLVITPYTIVKSRTGGVISRLLSRLDLDFVAAQVLAPTQEFAETYADYMAESKSDMKPGAGQLLSDYIRHNFGPSEGRRHRVLLLLFRGENACRKLSDVAGAVYPENLSIESIKGETVRDTYADLVWHRKAKGKVDYFEPAVLTPPSMDRAVLMLKNWADFAHDQENLVQNMVYPDPQRIEQTLVIIKPDNWRARSSRPGSIIDMFSRTGLRIIGMKLYQMSVSEAMEFYGPVRTALRERLSPNAGMRAKALLEKEFNLPLPEEVEDALIESFGMTYAEDQWSQIVEFMSGMRPEDCEEDQRDTPGSVKSLLLVYEGESAVMKIREVLGPTDPTKAPGGTVRADFGTDIMVNTAHASDSAENSAREMRIVKMQQNGLAQIIYDYLADWQGT